LRDEKIGRGIGSVGGETGGGGVSESSKVELEENKEAKRVAFSVGELAIEWSDRNRGGKEGVVKLLEIFLAKDQKDLSVGDKDRSAHFFLIKVRFAFRIIALQRFLEEKKTERECREGESFMARYALSLVRQASAQERSNHFW